MTLLHIENLSVHTLEGEVLVEPISFTLDRGEHITILGETGSGKSLLIQDIMGALPQGLSASGRISIKNGKFSPQSHRLSQFWGNTLTMLPQEPRRALDPIMTIHQQLWESLHFIGNLTVNDANRQVKPQLRRLGLASSQFSYPHQLSGGMAQRAAFAIATAAGGDIMLADEPTKGLDEANKQAVIRLLKQTTQSGGGLLTITHDIEVATALGGYIFVMKKGILVEQGQAQDILHSPKHAYTQALIAADPKRWQALPKITPNQPLVSVKQLTLRRGKRTLFCDLNFTVGRGEILGIIGKSGVGKSSLADALCGLLKPLQGEISWHSRHQKHQVLRLYQDPPEAFAANVPLQTLLDDVIKRHRLDRSQIPPLLAQLGLSEAILARTADTVSGGELQRVAILRALLLEPILLFADEVTSRLDPITQRDTIDLLVSLCRKRQFGLILVSHDRYLIEKSCDKVINLEEYAISHHNVD